MPKPGLEWPRIPMMDGSDWDTFPASGGFYFQASDGSVTLPAAGHDYDIDWTLGGTCTRWNGS
jgi:hypothetical protein